MTIGELVWYITGDTSGLTAAQKKANSEIIKTQEQFKKAGAAIKQVGDKLTDVGKKMTTFVTLPILAAGAASLKFAADYEVANRKFQKAFEGAIPQAEEALQILNEQYGVSISQGTKMLAFTGDLLKGFGATADQALKTSLSVQQLAASLAAYNGVPVEQASQAITTALLGEREALKSLGVVISEEAVQQELLRLGQDKLTGQALLLAKAQATLTLAYQQSGDAVAGMSENQDTLAFQTQKLLGDLKDLAIQVGTILIPYAKAFVAEAQKWVKWFADLNETQKKGIIIIAGVVAAIGPLLVATGTVISTIGSIASAMPVVVQAVTALGTAATTASGGMVALAASSAAVLGPIALVVAGTAALVVGLKAYGKAVQDTETSGGFEAAGASLDRYALTLKMTTEEVGRLREQQERFFSIRSTETESYADFEAQALEFADKNKLTMQQTVTLLKTSTALNKEQVGYADELAKKYGEAELATWNQASNLELVNVYANQSLSQQKKEQESLRISRERNAAAAKKDHDDRLREIDATIEAGRLESEEIMERIRTVRGFEAQNAEERAKKAKSLRLLEAEYSEAKKKEDQEALDRATELNNSRNVGIGISIDSGAVLQQFGIIGEATQTFWDTEKGKALKAADDIINSFGDKYNMITGIVTSALSSIQGFVEGLYSDRLNKIDAEMNKELEKNGLIEESERARAERALADAKEKGDKEAELEAEKALKKIDIEEKYAKKKRRIEYEGAVAEWGFSLASAIITAPQMIMNAWNTGMQFGPASLVMAPLLTGLATAMAAAQIGTIIANKPSPPKFATGGIVPASTRGQQVIAGENGNELLLSDGTQGSRLLDGFADRVASRNGGGKMNIILNLDGRMIAQSTAEYMNNGVVTIDMNRAARA